MTFRIDEEAKARALGLLNAASSATPLDRGEWLHGAGWLIAMGATDELPGTPDGLGPVAVLRAVDTSGLCDAALALVITLEERARGDEDDLEGSFDAQVIEQLDPRTRFELQRLAAEHLDVGADTAPTADQDDDLAYFDETLRPHVWRLIGANEARAPLNDAILPELRERFWWLHEGIGLPAAAVHHLPRVSMLVAQYPEAARELRELARTYEILTSGEPAASNVVSLGDWIRRRSATPDDTKLKVAARDVRSGRVPLVETSEYVVSVIEGSELVVDVLTEINGAITLEIDGGLLEASADPDDPGRFTFVLDEGELSATRARLHLPLASGAVTLALPPDD